MNSVCLFFKTVVASFHTISCSIVFPPKWIIIAILIMKKRKNMRFLWKEIAVSIVVIEMVFALQNVLFAVGFFVMA